MLSVRITAAGAVFVCCLSCVTAPARACDDRYIKKCEKAAAAEFAAEEAGTPGAKRASKRVKVVASRQSRHTRLVRHRQAPRFAARLARRVALDDGAERRAALPDTPMARRFRGFIDPQPMSQHAFEALRKPHLVSLDFDAAAIVPVVDAAEAAPAASAAVSPAAPPA